jgi:glycosyltransferase involved in cell wall biosynthesis
VAVQAARSPGETVSRWCKWARRRPDSHTVKILLAADDCALGGHTCFMSDLATELGHRGHFVRCFFFHDSGHAKTVSRLARTTIGGVDALRGVINRDEIEVVHGDSCMIDLPRLVDSLSPRPRLVITRHAWNAPMGWRRGNCEAYVAVSPSSADLCAPFTDHAIHLVPNGIDTDLFRPHPGDTPACPVIAWCGRSSDPVKNWARYVSVTWHLGERFECHAADSDVLTSGLERYAEGATHIGLRQRFSRAELPEFFARVARSGGCLLSTSRAEGLPLSLVEALACGCPVLGPDVRGVRDVLCGDLSNCLYPAEASDVEVAHFIREMLPRISRDTFRRTCREHVLTRFSVTTMADAYERIYSRAGGPVSQTSSAEVAARLWQHAAEVEKEGRFRDAIFDARSAAALRPQSLTRPDRLALLLRCGSASRLRGARAVLTHARERFQRRDYRQGLLQLVRACRLHPGALLLRESPLRRQA